MIWLDSVCSRAGLVFLAAPFQNTMLMFGKFLDLQVLGGCDWNWKDEYFLSLPCSTNREIHIWGRSPFHTTLGHVPLMEVLLWSRVGTWAFDVGLPTQTLASCCSEVAAAKLVVHEVYAVKLTMTATELALGCLSQLKISKQEYCWCRQPRKHWM